LVIFCCAMGRVVIDVKVGRELVKFGAPLIVNSLLQLLMHEADRYFLLAYLDMKEVGVYSLAYKVGQAVNTLCLIPFGSIWGVMIYEIAKQPDAKQQYARVFEYFVSAVLVLMLGASLSAVPLLPFLTTEAFDGAIQLLPVILLAFVFFTLHSQFNVPALLAKKTVTLVPSAIAGVATNLILNSILVPRFGATGAAWSSVMTYAVFSFSGLVMYRRIDVIPYPFAKCAAITAGIALTYVVVQHGLFPQLSLINQLLASILVCVAWTLILFGTLIAGWVKEKLLLRRVRPA
jgi:O-antigen/teichoic acid export membrane protein